MIGNTLKEIMNQYNISVHDLAYETKLHPISINKFRSNKRRPSIESKQAIIKALNILIKEAVK